MIHSLQIDRESGRYDLHDHHTISDGHHHHAPDYSPQAICFGEILFDHIGDQLYLGGAPLNFACYLAQFGASVGMVSAVGRDELGDRALRMLSQADIDCRWVSKSDMPTGVVEVSLIDGQPSYSIVEQVAWDAIPDPGCTGGDLFYLGTLAQRTPENLETAHHISHHHFNHVFLDVNLRQHYYSPQVIISSLSHATFVKMSEEEWPVIAKITASASIEALLTRYGLQGAALTRGENGAELITPGQRFNHPGFPADVVDAVGAGDAFSAVIAAALLQDVPLEIALEAACRVGAYVVSHAGAQVSLPDDMKSLLRA